MTLTPIATPVGLLTRRAHLAQKVLDAWPYQPPEISRVVIAALENPRTTVDYLLWLGDLFGDAASELSASGKVAAYHGMVALSCVAARSMWRARTPGAK